jgi:DNA-directed RNA polymerase subunit RPC12/RpoP
MSMTTTLGEDGFWCPYCGEFIEKEELDCDDIYELHQHGDVFFECPYCGADFWLENCEKE